MTTPPPFPLLAAFAPAKINLYLHVTGQRHDSYHFLDSLVAFADVGDRLFLTPAPSFSLSLVGPMAPLLRDTDSHHNLVARAAQAMSAHCGRPLDFALTLEKNLPIASGIGGGSTDAATALRLIARHWGLPDDAPLLTEIAARLGQDVPCCLSATTCLFEGIGDTTRRGPALPPFFLLLVNPNVGVATPAVFKRLAAARAEGRAPFTTPATPLDTPPHDAPALVDALKKRSNDLTRPAIDLLPEIQEVLNALTSLPDCVLTRMSGSGATCFGLFLDAAQAEKACHQLQQAHPTWWIRRAALPFSSEQRFL